MEKNNEIDLTLRLGLPNTYEEDYSCSTPFTFIPLSPMHKDKQVDENHIGNSSNKIIPFSAYPNFNTNVMVTSAFPPLVRLQMNPYTFTDTLARCGGASSSTRNRRGRPRAYASLFDPNSDSIKRCTNINCRTNKTPMWRKGPLGPKSLCNACGIKYSVDERKKAAQLEEMARQVAAEAAEKVFLEEYDIDIEITASGSGVTE